MPRLQLRVQPHRTIQRSDKVVYYPTRQRRDLHRRQISWPVLHFLQRLLRRTDRPLAWVLAEKRGSSPVPRWTGIQSGAVGNHRSFPPNCQRGSAFLGLTRNPDARTDFEWNYMRSPRPLASWPRAYLPCRIYLKPGRPILAARPEP